MPILKRRSKHVKVYRPSGTRYAEAKMVELKDAMDRAWHNFAKEFGDIPDQERTVVEVMGVTCAWDVTVFELPKEDE